MGDKKETGGRVCIRWPRGSSRKAEDVAGRWPLGRTRSKGKLGRFHKKLRGGTGGKAR